MKTYTFKLYWETAAGGNLVGTDSRFLNIEAKNYNAARNEAVKIARNERLHDLYYDNMRVHHWTW